MKSGSVVTDEYGSADGTEEEFACGIPVIKELVIILVVDFEFENLDEFGPADVGWFGRFQPATVDAVMFDKRGESAIGFDLC